MNTVGLLVDGLRVEVPEGATVAAAVAHTGHAFRRSESGQPRAPLCGMGVCFECRVSIDAVPQLRACMVLARPGMRVETQR